VYRNILVNAVLVAVLVGCSGGPVGTTGGDVSAPGETWSKSFGGPENDQAQAVAVTRDGGFVFVGTSDARPPSAGVFRAVSGDFWLNKLDAGGNSELERVIGPRRQLGSDGSAMSFRRAQPTADGGFVLVGHLVADEPALVDIAVVRLDSSGAVLWARTYDSGPWLQYEYDTVRGTSAAEAHDTGVDIAVTADGFWVVAISNADLRSPPGLQLPPFSDAESLVVMRLDTDGNVRALQRLTDDAYERSYFRFPPLIRATADGGAALARARISDGQPRLAVQKLNADAVVQWTRQLEEIGRPTDLIQTDDVPPSLVRDGQRDDGFLVSGSSHGTRGVVAKLTAAGDVEWQDVFNDADDIDFTAYPQIAIYGITQRCSDSFFGPLCTYAVAGSYIGDEGQSSQGYVVHIDSTGALLRDRTIPETNVVLDVDGGNEGAAFRVLAYGEGTSAVSEGGTLLTLNFASLDTIASHAFELGEFGFDAGLAPAGPLVLAKFDQRLVQHDSLAAAALEVALSESGSREDVATAVLELAAGRYLVAGRTRSFSELEAGAGETREEAWVMRFDAATGIVWQRRLAPGMRGGIVAMAASGDEGAVLAGQLFGALRVVKLDADGRLVWQSAPLVTAQDLFSASLAEVHRTTDGGYIAVGSASDTNSVVVKLDARGIVQWSRSFDIGAAQSIHPTADGGFIVAARSLLSPGLSVVLKLGSDGESQWIYEYSFFGGINVGVTKIRQLQDGGYILGLSESGVVSDSTSQGTVIPVGQTNMLLMKLDSNGGVTWSRSYGGLFDEGITDVQPLADGGFVTAGWSDSLGDGREAWLLRLGPDGFVAGGSCNAYLGSIPARSFGLRIPAMQSTVVGAIADNGAASSSIVDTNESAREPAAHVVARQCLGPVTNIVEGTPLPPTSHGLVLDFVGDGRGSVRSNPESLECTSACRADFPAGRLVILTPTPAEDSAFAGWENCSSTEGERCLVLMNEPRELRVRFEPARPSLNVTLIGDGVGVVTSDVPGISCDADCSEDYPNSTSVVLTAAPDNTSSFTGWSGCDTTDRLECTVRVDRRRTVSAEFRRLTTTPTSHELLVEMHPESRGIGSIESSPALVSCQVELTNVQQSSGGPCAYSIPSGSTYTIIAVPEPGTTTTFVSWSGCDSNPTPLQCQVTVTAPRTVRPRFSAP
jgi:hypothetical protein